MALVHFMRPSLTERRTRGFVQCGVAGNPGTLRSEAVNLISLVVCGRKAPKSNCQQASPGSFDSAQDGSSTPRHKAL